jgi:hypothetical protein
MKNLLNIVLKQQTGKNPENKSEKSGQNSDENGPNEQNYIGD